MKNSKVKAFLLLASLVLLMSFKPVLALNQYSVHPGAQFRWDATKYIFLKNGLGIGNNLEYTHSYSLEFNFTNWAGLSGAEYLNGTVNSNGTIYDGEISHTYYYFGTPGQSWVTEIIDIPGPAPVHVYLVCNTEIDQTTRPDLQYLEDNFWITVGEAPTNNFSLIGNFNDGSVTWYYTGNIKFNSDNVLSHIFDELVAINNSNAVTLSIERYVWNLSYTAGTPPTTPNGGNISGFSLVSLITAITLGFIFIEKRKQFKKSI
ncbi:MAG: hypothetical protein ACXABG_11835 [Promethearchaeota archaeon]|jgi:hypothetical protein